MKRIIATTTAAAIAALTLAGGASAATCSSLDATASYATFGSCTGTGNDSFATLSGIVATLFGDEGITVTEAGSFTPGGGTESEFVNTDRMGDDFASSGLSNPITFTSLPANTIFVSLKQGGGFELFPVLSPVPFSLTHSLNGNDISHVSTLAGTGTPPIGGEFGVVPLPAAMWLLLAGIGGLAAIGRRRRAA